MDAASLNTVSDHKAMSLPPVWPHGKAPGWYRLTNPGSIPPEVTFLSAAVGYRANRNYVSFC